MFDEQVGILHSSNKFFPVKCQKHSVRNGYKYGPLGSKARRKEIVK